MGRIRGPFVYAPGYNLEGYELRERSRSDSPGLVVATASQDKPVIVHPFKEKKDIPLMPVWRKKRSDEDVCYILVTKQDDDTYYVILNDKNQASAGTDAVSLQDKAKRIQSIFDNPIKLGLWSITNNLLLKVY